MLWEGDKLMYGDVSYDRAYSGDTLIWLPNRVPTGLTLVTNTSTITTDKVYVLALEPPTPALPLRRQYVYYNTSTSNYEMTWEVQQALKLVSNGTYTSQQTGSVTYIDTGSAFGLTSGAQLPSPYTPDGYYMDIREGGRSWLTTITSDGVTYENIIYATPNPGVNGLGYRSNTTRHQISFKTLGSGENNWQYIHLYQLDF